MQLYPLRPVSQIFQEKTAKQNKKTLKKLAFLDKNLEVKIEVKFI